MRKTTKKILGLASGAVLLVGISIMGTMAYFTDNDANINTFTVGKVQIELDEYDVDGSNTNTSVSGRDKANKYHLIPGQEYRKDPTVTIKKNSEASYVFMTVTVKGLKYLELALPNEGETQSYYAGDVFLLQNLCDWTPNSDWEYAGFKLDGDNGEYRFYYNGDKGNGAPAGETVLPALFEKITVPGKHITSNNIGYLENIQIDVKAYAIQAAGFESADDAWKAAYGNDTEGYIIPASSI